MTRLAAIGRINDRTILGMIEYIAQPICAIQLGSCAVNIKGPAKSTRDFSYIAAAFPFTDKLTNNITRACKEII
jgi:hypothetical protein